MAQHRASDPAESSALSRVWHRVVRLYRDVEDTSWGRRLLGNVWPAYVFALPPLARAFGLFERYSQGTLTLETPRAAAALAQDLASLLFQALIVVLFVVRRPLAGAHTNWIGGLVALGGTFLLNVVAFLPVQASATYEQFLGSAVVTLVGTLFTCWSLATLGRCFGLFPEVRGLVTRGPYRWIRHPVYLGELVSAVGLAIAKPDLAVVGIIVAFVLLQLWRMRLEERALKGVFPEEYPAYQRRTGRLLPRWR